MGKCDFNVWSIFFLVDGAWSEWEAWGECLKPCGVSRSIRRRTCDKPEPKYRGKPCDSSQANETRECNLAKCTGKNFRNYYILELSSIKIMSGEVHETYIGLVCLTYYGIPG